MLQIIGGLYISGWVLSLVALITVLVKYKKKMKRIGKMRLSEAYLLKNRLSLKCSLSFNCACISKSSGKIKFFPVTLKQWSDPIPSRTRPSNAALPMVVLV